MAFDVAGPGGKRTVRPSMNVTPLVDVVLVLLIIFMVVTPLLTKQLWMHVPEKLADDLPPPAPDAVPPVVLTLARSGEVRINREPVPASEVVARLQRMINARADKIVFFDAHDDQPYEAAMKVIDLARGGGLSVAVLPDKVVGE